MKTPEPDIFALSLILFILKNSRKKFNGTQIMVKLDYQWVFDKSPSFVRTLMVNVYAMKIHKERYGRKFIHVMNELEQTQYFSEEKIKQYQNEHLIRIIKHAYGTVSYYRDAFDKIKLKPIDIKSIDDLYKVPLLTREDVQNHNSNLISRNYKNAQLVHGHTSGTTGTPLNFVWDINTCVYTNAVDWRQKNWAGIKYGEPIALLLGRKIVPTARKKPPFWAMDYLHNQLWLSTFHMSEKTLMCYVDKLMEFKPVAIEGYPSTVYILARFLKKNNITLPVRAILTSSETLYPIQKEVIEGAFKCKIFDYYGLAERIVFATECEKHSGHHLNYEYGITEFVNDNNEPVQNGEQGYLVGTSLQNFAMPFIRYKTTDVTSVKIRKCTCGRNMPLMDDVTTKAEDIVVTPDGKMISASILTHPFKPLKNIEKSQIIQNDINTITIKIVKRQTYTKNDTEVLLKQFKNRVGEDMIINIKFVDDIPRTESGKYRWVISRVPLPLK